MSEAYVLGLGYSTHDASVCLMRDGEVVAAITKERLTRYKHDGGFLTSRRYASEEESSWDLSVCIDYCLEAAGIPLDRVDLFVENHLMNRPFEAFHREEVARFKRPYPVERTIMISHHLAHAYSAYHGSGFDDALVMVVDGEGNSLDAIRLLAGEDAAWVQTPGHVSSSVRGGTTEKISLYSVRAGRFEVLRKDFTVGSVGGAYRLATIYIFDESREAGKTMGLAPFGRAGAFDGKLIESSDGIVSYPYLGTATNMEVPPPAKRWPEEVASWSDDLRMFADLAYHAQSDVERALVDVARSGARMSGHRKLCIAGGVGLNSVANKKIVDEVGFSDIYITPPAGDDGLSIGCAYWGTHRGLRDRPAIPRRKMRFAAHGRDYPEARIERALSSDPRLIATRLSEPEILERTSTALADAQIVGWYQGGSEMGPRALGHRSILADARHPDMKAILNRRVKFREAFRPFAPVVPLENVREYFELDRPSPYMLLIAPVRPEMRAKLPSITHVDGTARVQTVTEEDNGRFYRLVKAVGARTGVPVIVNTSFNIKGEPIVETPEEAVDCFLCNDMDLLVMGDWMVSKRALSDEELLSAVPAMNRRVVVRTEHRFGDEGWSAIEANVFFVENVEHRMEVSSGFAEMLQLIDGQRTAAAIAAELAERSGVESTEAETALLKALRLALQRNLLRLAAAS